MSRIINPILLDKPPQPVASTKALRPSPETASDTTFAAQLAAAQNATNVEAPASTNAAQALSVEPSPNVQEDTAITPATSWRVDRSASEVPDEDDGFSFEDFVDMINPLHHIPIVGTIYREMTDDTIKPVSRVAGDVMYGALTGNLLVSCISSVVSAAYEQNEGAEPLTQVADALFGSSDEPAPTMMAQAEIPPMPEVDSSMANGNVKLAALETPAPSAEPTVQTVNKQPYGGVMDLAGAERNQRTTTSVASAGNTQGVTIGNTIYTTPTMNVTAKAQSLQAAKAVPAQQLASLTAPISPQSGALPVPGTTSNDTNKLGQMMHQSAQNTASGNALPPELVRDMMLMALDKYKTAGNMAPSEMTIGAVN